jgi:hypothetical protein
VHVTWSRPARGKLPAQGPFELDLFVETGDGDAKEAARRRLS